MRFARWTRVLGASALIGLASAGAARAQGVHDARGQALRLYEAGRYAEALPYFNEVLRRKPHDVDLLNKRGCIYIRLNQPARALPDLDKVAREAPLFSPAQVYPSAFTNRGIAKLMLGRDDESLADFQRSISIREAHPEPSLSPAGKTWQAGLAAAYGGLGQYYYRKDDHAKALEAYNKALSHNPADPNAHVGRGLALGGLKQDTAAVTDFDEAIRLDPNHSRAYGYRAAAFARLGQDEKALSDYATSIRLDPNVAMTHRLRGALLSKLGKHGAAIADLNDALRLDPKDAEAYKDRGGIYNRMGDSERGLRDLDEAVRLSPRNAKAYQNRAASYNGLARYDEAIHDCDEALRLDPKNSGALNNRGLALVSIRRYDRAITDLTESLRLDPNQAAAYVNRGSAYAQIGMFGPAAADFDEAARREPRVALAVNDFGPIRDFLHQRARSTSDNLAVLEPVPEARDYCDRGNAKRGQGDWAGAVEEFSRALATDPKCAEAYALRGWSRLCAGERGADADARSWFGLSSWNDPFAPYMALLGVLAARHDGRELAASAFLDEAMAHTRSSAWPAPVFRYLKREISASELIATAADPKKLTEARAVVGIDLLTSDDREAGLAHLRWVRDQGVDRSIARDLARVTLLSAEGPIAAPSVIR